MRSFEALTLEIIVLVIDQIMVMKAKTLHFKKD